jgi:hypothetical protein
MVFDVEIWADGDLFFEAPNKACLIVRPAQLEQNDATAATSRRVGRTGNPFRIERGRAERWISNGHELMAINDEERMYERVTLRSEDGEKRVPWLLYVEPCQLCRELFLLDFDAEQIRRDFQFELKRNSPRTVVIVATPRSAKTNLNLGERWIIVDRSSWRTTAVKFFDPSGNLETVYQFQDWATNVKLPEDCFNPDLERAGYRTIPPVPGK